MGKTGREFRIWAGAMAVLAWAGMAAADPLVIAAWGDSLTAGKGTTDPAHAYPAVACRLIGGDCLAENQGWGGQSSRQIAARMGAVPLILTPAGVGGGEAGMALAPPEIDVLEIGGQPIGRLSGTLAGVSGKLMPGPAGDYAFMADVPGLAPPAQGPQIFVPTDGPRLRDAETWIWAGRNNLRDGEGVLRDIAAMIGSLGHDRFLVGEILPSIRDNPGQMRARLALNAALQGIYGSRFVPLLAPLQAAGDGSARDRADARMGQVPGSLRSDRLHLSDAGYRVVAEQFVAAWRARQ